MEGETITAEKTTHNAPQRVERLFMENNLLRIMGFLFCHDKRVASAHTAALTNIEELVKHPITIEPHPTYGQPGPGHFKVFLAILKKLSDYGRPVPNKVYFSRAELARPGARIWDLRDRGYRILTEELPARTRCITWRRSRRRSNL
jgi:hypothetical protein